MILIVIVVIYVTSKDSYWVHVQVVLDWWIQAKPSLSMPLIHGEHNNTSPTF